MTDVIRIFIGYQSKKEASNAPLKLRKVHNDAIPSTTKLNFSFFFNNPNVAHANTNDNNYHLHYSQPLDQEYSL